MGGVVAGSAIANYSDYSPNVRLVALTVNNKCNLKCPHCYLQYNGPSGYFSEKLQTKLISQPFEHLAIVGMEPFVSRDAARRTIELASRAKSVGKSVSAITNGYGLRFLEGHTESLFDFIDVSFDGGVETYSRFRGGSLSHLRRNLDCVQPRNLRMKALHTLFKENIKNIDDMLTVLHFYDFSSVIFSPYVETLNEGTNDVEHISIFDILNALAESQSFLEESRAYLLLDHYHLASERAAEFSVRAEVARLNLTRKVHFVPHTPLQIGSVRVTYDGLIMAPATALHTSLYRGNQPRLEEESIGSAYRKFLQQERAAAEVGYSLAVGS